MIKVAAPSFRGHSRQPDQSVVGDQPGQMAILPPMLLGHSYNISGIRSSEGERLQPELSYKHDTR